MQRPEYSLGSLTTKKGKKLTAREKRLKELFEARKARIAKFAKRTIAAVETIQEVRVATSRDSEGGLVWQNSSIVVRSSAAQRKAFEAARKVVASGRGL